MRGAAAGRAAAAGRKIFFFFFFFRQSVEPRDEHAIQKRDVSSSRAADVNVSTSTSGVGETSLVSNETRDANEKFDTKRPAVTVSFPASPESCVGTGVFTVEPP